MVLNYRWHTCVFFFVVITISVWTLFWLAATFFTECWDGKNSSADGCDITPMQVLTGWEDVQHMHITATCTWTHSFHQQNVYFITNVLPVPWRISPLRLMKLNFGICFVSSVRVAFGTQHATGGCQQGHPGSSLPGDTFYKTHLLTGFDQQILALYLWDVEPHTHLRTDQNDSAVWSLMISNTFSLHSNFFVLYLPCLFVKDVSILSPGGGIVANVVFIWPRSAFACFKPSAVCVRQQQVETYLSAAFWGWWVSRVSLMLPNLEMIIFPWFGPSLSH